MDLKITYVWFPKHYNKVKNLKTFLKEVYLSTVNPNDGKKNLSPKQNTWVEFIYMGEKILTTLLSFLSDDKKTGWGGFKKLQEWVNTVEDKDYSNTAKQKLKDILKYFNNTFIISHNKKRKRGADSFEKRKKKEKLPANSLKIRIPSEIKKDEKFLRDLENADEIVKKINEKRCETYLTDKRFEELTKKMGKKNIVSILETHIRNLK